MAANTGETVDVINGLVREEVRLMKMQSDVLGLERKDIDRLRVQRYQTLDDIEISKKTSMEVDCQPTADSLKEKQKLADVLEATISRKQQYAAILSDIIEDRRRNCECLSKYSCSVIEDGMAQLNVSQ